MWEINNSFQVLSFIRSVGLGIIFALIYDILRSFRSVKENSVWQIFFQDVTYSLICAFTTFTFLLCVTNGEIRGFTLIGIFMGFFISRVTFSLLWFRFLKFVFGWFFRLFDVISRRFYLGFDFLEKNIVVFCKKTVETLKKLLKKSKVLLYTKKVKKIKEA